MISKKWMTRLLIILCNALLFFGIYFVIHFSEQQLIDEEIERIHITVQNAAIECYAIEGMYPKDISYLQEVYGLKIDTEHYRIFYTSIGDNIMPIIDVVGKK